MVADRFRLDPDTAEQLDASVLGLLTDEQDLRQGAANG